MGESGTWKVTFGCDGGGGGDGGLSRMEVGMVVAVVELEKVVAVGSVAPDNNCTALLVCGICVACGIVVPEVVVCSVV